MYFTEEGTSFRYDFKIWKDSRLIGFFYLHLSIISFLSCLSTPNITIICSARFTFKCIFDRVRAKAFIRSTLAVIVVHEKKNNSDATCFALHSPAIDFPNSVSNLPTTTTPAVGRFRCAKSFRPAVTPRFGLHASRPSPLGPADSGSEKHCINTTLVRKIFDRKPNGRRPSPS